MRVITKTIFLLAFAFGSISCSAQILWELPIYVSDAIGNKDTVSLAFAVDGTYDTDSHLGEIEINTPWDTIFEVRFKLGDNSFPNSPQYKKFILPQDQFGTESFASFAARLIVHAAHSPITVEFDSTLIGYPSLVNLIFDRTGLPQTLEPWYTQTDTVPPEFPTFHCMMNTSQIVENFSYFLFADTIHPGTGIHGTYIHLANGDTIYTPGFDIYALTSWAGNYYCDRIVGTNNPLQKVIDLFIENPVSESLRISHDYQSIDEYVIYNLAGKLVDQGKLIQGVQIAVSGLSSGQYIFMGKNKTGDM